MRPRELTTNNSTAETTKNNCTTITTVPQETQTTILDESVRKAYEIPREKLHMINETLVELDVIKNKISVRETEKNTANYKKSKKF